MKAGPETDALVAEFVMGEPRPVYAPSHVNFIEITWSESGNWRCLPAYVNGDICEWKPRPFSSDISAAKMVIEKLAVKPFAWHIESINTDLGLRWFVDYWDDGSKPGSFLDWSDESESLELSVCRVALLAKLTKAEEWV